MRPSASASRRLLLLAGCTTAPWLRPATRRAFAADGRAPPLSPRLDASTLSPLTAFGVPSRTGELHYPPYLLGTWRVTNTISGFAMPLGAAFSIVCPTDFECFFPLPKNHKKEDLTLPSGALERAFKGSDADKYNVQVLC